MAGTLAQLIDSLGVVVNKANLVAGTKTLHHLQPRQSSKDLVITQVDKVVTNDCASVNPNS